MTRKERIEEIITMLKMVVHQSSAMPDYIADENNYPTGKTTVIEDIKPDTLSFIIDEAIKLLREED